ncbi:Asterix [Brachionus plicatilis]|uniref:Asterix n=1 Tax=Brachionus plicatilis TaxID=10195 RepID=A0A3M7S7I5_BRAPC|nr:Asterix [Brachionus plicatilis]
MTSIDLRRNDKIKRFKSSYTLQFSDDNLQEYMNVMGMIFSMCGLMMKVKWCAWISVLCSFIGFANARGGDDSKQIFSCFMLSISAVVMSYLQNPTPMTLPFM